VRIGKAAAVIAPVVLAGTLFFVVWTGAMWLCNLPIIALQWRL